MFKIFVKYSLFLIIFTSVLYSQNFSLVKILIKDKDDNSKKSSMSVMQLNTDNRVSNSSKDAAYKIFIENISGNVQ